MQQAERLCRRVLILKGGAKAFEGSVEEARRLLPRRVRLEAPADLSFLASAAGRQRARGSRRRPAWLGGGAGERHRAGALLAACVERGVIPTRFDSSEPTLHEVFVAVVGAEGQDLPTDEAA